LSDEQLKKAFNLFDLDKNGVIDAKVFVFNSNELVTSEEAFLVFVLFLLKEYSIAVNLFAKLT
jgi:Ca2+-binding EF-hand superfamily protein